jgi:hypothetical protein
LLVYLIWTDHLHNYVLMKYAWTRYLMFCMKWLVRFLI